MAVAASVGTARVRRPKDRKEQIARVSAEAFSQYGYHAVSMEDIATRVGVSAASLYRHYSGKYELFRDAVLNLVQQLADSTAFLDDAAAEADPAAAWEDAVRALVDTTLKRRSSGGLYRWEFRYLEPDDQRVLVDAMVLVNRRIQRPLAALRPNLDSHDRWRLSTAVLSVIGSITDHRARLGADDVRATMGAIARALRDTDLPRVDTVLPGPVRTGVGAAAGEYEAILHEAMVLFNEKGYAETGMDDIAAAASVPTSRIYRYFSRKSAILAAVYRRAADRVSGDVATVLSETTDPRLVVDQLIEAYVQRSFDSPELAYVYYAERSNVPAEDQVALHSMQRATIEAWVGQVVAAQPKLTAAQARFAVHAAYAIVIDVGRLVSYSPREDARELVRHLMRVAVLEPVAERPAEFGRTRRAR